MFVASLPTYRELKLKLKLKLKRGRMSFYLVQSDNGLFHLSSTWPKTNTKAFRKGILCLNAPATLFKTRLEARQALARTRKYADRYYPHWRTWLDTSFIVRARLA